MYPFLLLTSDCFNLSLSYKRGFWILYLNKEEWINIATGLVEKVNCLRCGWVGNIILFHILSTHSTWFLFIMYFSTYMLLIMQRRIRVKDQEDGERDGVGEMKLMSFSFHSNRHLQLLPTQTWIAIWSISNGWLLWLKQAWQRWMPWRFLSQLFFLFQFLLFFATLSCSQKYDHYHAFILCKVCTTYMYDNKWQKGCTINQFL